MAPSRSMGHKNCIADGKLLHLNQAMQDISLSSRGNGQMRVKGIARCPKQQMCATPEAWRCPLDFEHIVRVLFDHDNMVGVYGSQSIFFFAMRHSHVAPGCCNELCATAYRLPWSDKHQRGVRESMQTTATNINLCKFALCVHTESAHQHVSG